MATTSKQFFRGSASLTETTLYSVPLLASAVVTNLILTNTSADPQTATVELDGVEIVSDIEIPGKSVVTWDMKQVLGELDIITASASSTAIRIHVSGVEIS